MNTTPSTAYAILVSGLLICTALSPAQAQSTDATTAKLNLPAGQSMAYRFANTDPRWPDLLATGASSVTVKWTCAKSNNDKLAVNPQMFFKETVGLADKEQLSTHQLMPKAFALVDFCATHQLEISNAGPGSLTLK
jgi:hypothetical protein